MSERLGTVVRGWTRLGAAFGSEPADAPPDLERLLLDTARCASGMARLFIMSATWLHRYGDLVAKHRLKKLVKDELEPAFRPVLGLLLDLAQQGTQPPEFRAVVKGLEANNEARPLFEIERSSHELSARAERRASAISRKWGLWCEPFEFKDDALRPARWVMAQNPEFITRADFKGDLRASVMAALRHDDGADISELNLARLAGGSRAQVRNALTNLELSGKVERTRDLTVRRIRISLIRAA